MDRERPPPEAREAVCPKHSLSGPRFEQKVRKRHDFRGVAPYHPFSPSTP